MRGSIEVELPISLEAAGVCRVVVWEASVKVGCDSGGNE